MPLMEVKEGNTHVIGKLTIVGFFSTKKLFLVNLLIQKIRYGGSLVSWKRFRKFSLQVLYSQREKRKLSSQCWSIRAGTQVLFWLGLGFLIEFCLPLRIQKTPDPSNHLQGLRTAIWPKLKYLICGLCFSQHVTKLFNSNCSNVGICFYKENKNVK